MPVAPPLQRVGVIGGGQLAWMLAGAAPDLGLDLAVQTPNRDDPAVSRAAKVVLGAVDDLAATRELARHCDAITFENEFVDLDGLRSLRGTCFRPSLDSLAPLLDKYDQLRCLQAAGVPVPDFMAVPPTGAIASPWGFPVVLKTRRQGYDGCGTAICKTPSELQAARERFGATGLLLQTHVPFTRELAVMAARGVAGDIAIYPVVETRQVDRVCRWTIAPAPVSTRLRARVGDIARRILEQLDIVGIVGVELFQTDAETTPVLVNEIAPRTHNSGHYTLDACATSQFAMQLRAIAGLPLATTDLTCAAAVMVNLLGTANSDSNFWHQRQRLAELPGARVHWYGKTARPGRKLGHVTVCLDDPDYAAARAVSDRVWQLWSAPEVRQG